MRGASRTRRPAKTPRDQPCQHRGTLNGDGDADRSDPLSRQRLFRRGGVEARARLDRRRDRPRDGPGLRAAAISPITRCAATQVNPVTAERDLAIPAALDRNFGHINMGIYAEVLARRRDRHR